MGFQGVVAVTGAHGWNRFVRPEPGCGQPAVLRERGWAAAAAPAAGERVPGLGRREPECFGIRGGTGGL